MCCISLGSSIKRGEKQEWLILNFFPRNALYKSIHKIMGNKSIYDKRPSEMLRTWAISLSGTLLFTKSKGTRVK